MERESKHGSAPRRTLAPTPYPCTPPSQLTYLDDVPGAEGVERAASAINNHDEAIINVAPAPPYYHTASYLWQRGTHRQLGDFRLGSTSASSINDRGQVIGSSEDADTGQRYSFLFGRGRMVDLTRLVPPDAVPRALNNHGVMTGTVRTNSGQTHAALFFSQHGR